MNDYYNIMKNIFVNKEDVGYVLNDAHKLLHKALISFVYSTGLDNEQIIDLKISDLINACHNYLNNASEDSIDNLLNLNPSEIFPCWVFDNKSSIRIIYNTPETTEYLFSYLNGRKHYSTISSTDYLFSDYVKNKNKNERPATQLKKDYINKAFSRKNKELSEIRKKETFFTKNNLIFSFRKICNDNLDVDDADKEELTDLFFGKASKDNKFYQMYLEDKDSILKYYKQLLPYLEIKHHFEENTSTKDMEDTNLEDKPVENIDSNYYDEYEKFITEYYMEHIKNSHDTMYGMELKNWVYRYAKKYYDAKDLHDDVLCRLFKKAEVTILLDGKAGLSVFCSEDDLDKELHKLTGELSTLGLGSILGSEQTFILYSELEDFIYDTSFDPYHKMIFFDSKKLISGIYRIIDYGYIV